MVIPDSGLLFWATLYINIKASTQLQLVGRRLNWYSVGDDVYVSLLATNVLNKTRPSHDILVVPAARRSTTK